MKFVRFGGLSPVKQDYITDEDRWFHSPPRRKGNYAFVYGYVDIFLISSTDDPDNISNKSYWLKDKDGNRVKYDDFYENVNHDWVIKREWKNYLRYKKIKQKDVRTSDGYMFVIKKPKLFDYDGELWHHLGEHLRPEHIISSNGSWVKTTMKDFELALRLEIKSTLKEKHLRDFEYKYNSLNGKQNPFKNSNGTTFTKDHLEVFIEKIK